MTFYTTYSLNIFGVILVLENNNKLKGSIYFSGAQRDRPSLAPGLGMLFPTSNTKPVPNFHASSLGVNCYIISLLLNHVIRAETPILHIIIFEPVLK